MAWRGWQGEAGREVFNQNDGALMTNYLKIRNWPRWQSYRSDRGQPPWIKLHRSLMRNPEWVSLTDAQRGQLIALWLLAADRDGVILASPCLLKKLCFMDTEPDIELFTSLNFIEPDVIVASSWRQSDAPEESRVEESRGEREKRKSLTPSVFDQSDPATKKQTAFAYSCLKKHGLTISSWQQATGREGRLTSQDVDEILATYIEAPSKDDKAAQKTAAKAEEFKALKARMIELYHADGKAEAIEFIDNQDERFRSGLITNLPNGKEANK